MNNLNIDKGSISMAKSCEKAIVRTDESLAEAASVLKSLSNWGKTR